MKGDHKYFGRDEYFNSVIVESNDDLTGKIMNVRISKFSKTLFMVRYQQFKSNSLCCLMSEISKLEQSLIIKKLIKKQSLFL